MSHDPLLARLAAATEPSPERVGRLQEKVFPPSAAPLLRHLPDPGVRQPRPRPARWPRWPVAAVLGFGLAAGGMVPHAPVSAELGADTIAPFEVHGHGHVSLVGVAPFRRGEATVDWEVGTVRVDVHAWDPVVTVRTREAEVRVDSGTVTVARDALGTRVSGAAARCVGAEDGDLCLPVTGAGWLGRAQRLEELGEPPDTVLVALDAGLAIAGGDAADAELRAERAMVLWEAGRRTAAAAAAAAYPADGPRAAEMGAIVSAASGL